MWRRVGVSVWVWGSVGVVWWECVGVCGYVCGCGYVFTAHMSRSGGECVGVCVWMWRSVGMSTCGMYIYLYLLCSTCI